MSLRGVQRSGHRGLEFVLLVLFTTFFFFSSSQHNACHKVAVKIFSVKKLGAVFYPLHDAEPLRNLK